MKGNKGNIFEALDRNLQGDVYSDMLRRYMLSTDGSIFRKQPAGVVYPKETEDVVKTVLFAAENGLTVHPRGAGSGLCGSAIGKGMVVDFTKYMNRLLHIDYDKKTFECQPGFRFGELEALLKGKGLFFPPDPSSGEYATFGGMYATNASGAHSVKYGNVADYIVDAQVVLSNGQVINLSDIQSREYDTLAQDLQSLYRLYTENAETIEKAYPDVKYNSAGYNLRVMVQGDRLCLGKLLAGAEGTLGIVTRLKFRLLDKPAHDSLVVAFFDDIVSSAKAVQQILPLGPSGIEVMDKSLLKLARESDDQLKEKIPDGIDNLLLIEFDSPQADECAEQAQKVKALLSVQGLSNDTHLAVSASEKEKFWTVRKAAVPILYKLKGRKKIVALIEDAVVPTDRLVDYFEGIYRILNHHKVNFVLYGHIAKGLMHSRPLMDLKDPHDIDLLKTLADEIFDLVHALGGAVSGEHGDGRLRSAYIKRQYPQIYEMFLQTKQLLDEKNIFNPEIITIHDPEQMKKDLRYGTGYHGMDLSDKLLNWPEGFTTEVEKCHGCSKCTTITSVTRMCPIYKFTRDEAAAPKAKANILRALISGVVEDKDLYEATFQHVIDHCVNCGSCHKECPSNVNIPKMAIEARSQYVKKFGSSLEHRLVTSIELAGRTTHKFSAALKMLMGLKAVRIAGQAFTGISAQRDFIAFADRSLYERIRPVEGNGETRVLYFAGCYASYIRPEIGEAAVKVLKSLGMTVYTPPQHCCGLPMLSKGMIKQAKAKVAQNIAKWRDLLKRADHVVVTCSSCGLSLMKEWSYLLDGGDVNTLQGKTIHVSRLVNQNIHKLNLKQYPAKVSYHNPCHLKIQLDPQSSTTLLSQVPGLELEDLKSHCCGMAGSWGLSAKNYDLSVKIGSDMISKLNDSDASVGVTDCPTCRIQMEQLSAMQIRHPVEIIAQCLP